MKGKFKRVQFWCDHCDMQIVTGGMKCKKCGKRNKIPKIKNKKIIVDID